MLRGAGPVPFTALHQLEIRNAFERLVGRDLMTRKSVIRCSDSCETTSKPPGDTDLDLDGMFAHVSELSSRYAAQHLARRLDVLHIAAALASNSTSFVSADDRQLGAAKAGGLRVVDIKAAPARKGCARQKR